MMESTASRLFTTWVTSLDRVDHAVTDEECTARMIQNRGEFAAVCEAEFLPGPMEVEPGPPCPRCVEFLLNASRASQRLLEPSESPEKIRTRRSGLSRIAAHLTMGTGRRGHERHA